MVVKPSHMSKENREFAPIQLSTLAGYQRLGEYLSIKRKQFGLFQREMAYYLGLTESMYGFLERGRRAPQVEELVSLFAAIVQLQNDKHLPTIQIIEAESFYRLARAIIEKKGKKRPDLTTQQWDAIEQQLITLVDHRQQHQVRLVSGDVSSLEPLNSRRRKALDDILNRELKHVLEREDWATHVISYLDRVKVSVIQAEMGAGKTHALAVLTKRLARREDLFLIPYQFLHRDSMTPEDHLDEFLATLSADFTMRVTEETKQRPLTERIDQVLTAIRTHPQKVVFLIDDAQEIFPSADTWSASWHQFFASTITEQHEATLYLMTRVWPGWDERKRSFLEEDNLPVLSAEAAIKYWEWQGFDDVEEELLRKVCERCGHNPQVIEMLAFQYKRRGYSVSWRGTRDAATSHKKNPHTVSLEKLLASETLFSGQLDELSRQTLQQVFTNRLSGEDLRLLECLALAPLGIPFDLAIQWFDFLMPSYEKLVNASFADLGMGSAGRAAVIPLVREAVVQSLTGQQRGTREQQVTDIYTHWLNEFQEFKDDAEKAALIAEMVTRYIRSGHLLGAAELFITYGWLCTTFGQVMRIQRVFEEKIRAHRGKEETADQEVGRLLLWHRIAVSSGQPLERAERDEIYQSIFEKVVSGEVELQPHSEVEVLHNMLLFYNRKGQLVDASKMFDQTLERLQSSGKIKPEVYALFLFDKGRLMSYRADKENQPEASLQFTQASANCVRDCIANWRLCLKNALPLQEHYIQFKLARALNDLACDLRTLKHYSEAQEAIEESIKLKKKTGTPVYSIATALSECSQILAVQGNIRKASSINEEAKEMLEQSIADGDNMHDPELGLILKERANIFLLQGHLVDAKPLLEQAAKLMGNKPLRQKDKAEAEAQAEQLQLIINSSQLYQLDRRWSTRLSDLVNFNDTRWLTQSGPFNEEEWVEWEHLASQKDEQSSDRMSKLMIQSRKQEFTRSLEEQREPTIQYPYFPLKEVKDRRSGLKTLSKEIEAQETNVVVRRLYLEAINEHLTFLYLCEAIALQDATTALQCNLQLYGKPSEREFKIALQQICNMLLDARTHKLAGSAAQEALTQIEMWGLSPQDVVAEHLFVPTFGPIQQQVNHKLLANEKKLFSTATICKFFRDVLAMYGETDWNVYINPARDHTTVDPNIRELILPEKDFSVQKVRQLLAEEIEIHSYRSIAGRNSVLALLGSGLAYHLATDEGLAYHYVQSVNRSVYGKHEEKKWNATLTTGFASGVLTHPLSFPELRNFLQKMFLVSELLAGATWEAAVEFAQQAAWRRCSRVYKGAGCLSLKDRVYLQGHLEISNYLAHGGEEQRLYVGCVGVDHLEDMAELGILVPNYPHQHLALATDLAERLATYEK